MTYSPASNVLMIATIFGERLMYLPSAFFVILVAAAITRLPRAGGNVLLVALLCLGCVRTWTYVERWNNRDAFYEYSLRQQPKSLMIHILLADADYDDNQLATAARIMDEAESLYPGYWESWKMSALIDEKAGDWPKAARDWKRSFDLHPMMALSDRWGHALGMVSKEQAATRK
jgi:tetratricopeptide (TPR) repeat protein